MQMGKNFSFEILEVRWSSSTKSYITSTSSGELASREKSEDRRMRAHAVRVPPLLEVALEGARPPVRVVAADLALELEVEAVQLVQPVRDRLPVPPGRSGGVSGFVNRLLRTTSESNTHLSNTHLSNTPQV